VARDTIDRVRLSQQAVLRPGEYYTSAVRFRGKAGVVGFLGPFGWVLAVLKRRRPGQLDLPSEGIMATTGGRLLVFNSDRLRRVKPTTLVRSYRLGQDAHLVEVADPDAALGAGGQWTYVTLSLGGQQISIETPAQEAEQLAFAMRDHELDQLAPAPTEEPEPAEPAEVDEADEVEDAHEPDEPDAVDEVAASDVADEVDRVDGNDDRDEVVEVIDEAG
jgi:hypothetical protein